VVLAAGDLDAASMAFWKAVEQSAVVEFGREHLFWRHN
jgi:hypothetical protein